MASYYYIHQMRHFVAHLLRCQPDLLAILPFADRPEPFQDLEAWSSRLPHRRLVRVCTRLVEEAVRDLEFTLPLSHEVLRIMVTLPGEWDLDDAMALVVTFAPGNESVLRDDVVLSLEELLHRGLLVNGKESLRFVIPFPVRFSLKEIKLPSSEESLQIRRRIVLHYSSKALEEYQTDPSFRTSWRMTNLLHGFKSSVEWLEDQCGDQITSLRDENDLKSLPRDLGEALADFGKALGPFVAKRKSDNGWRWLMAAAAAAQSLGLVALEADLFRFMGRYFRQNNQFTEAVHCLERARRLYIRLPDPYQSCLMSTALALTRRDQGFPDQALREFEVAWMLSCEHGLDSEKISIANCAGTLCLKIESPEVARQWFMRGWKTAQCSSAYGDHAELCNNVGRSLHASDRLDEALHWHYEALKISQKELNRPAQATAYSEIARLWEDKGDPSSAIHWFERALRLRRDLSDAHGQATVLCDLARCSRANHQFADARNYAARARALARRHGLAELDGAIHLEIAELAVVCGEDEDAIHGFIGALERLGRSATATTLAQIHFRLSLLLYRRGALYDSARHMLSSQALSRHSQHGELLDEINPWLTIFSDQLEPERFESLVDHVTDLWETGELGGKNQESPKGGAPR